MKLETKLVTRAQFRRWKKGKRAVRSQLMSTGQSSRMSVMKVAMLTERGQRAMTARNIDN